MVPWLVVGLDVCVRMSLRMLECKSASLVIIDGESLLVFRIWGQVLSPPTGGSATMKIYVGCFVSLYHVAGDCVCFVITCASRE